MFKNSKVASSVRLGLTIGVLASSALLTSAVNAQESGGESESKTIEKISVTGSRIRSVNIESSSPVVTIDSELFDVRGTTDTVDLLNTIPSFFAAQTTAFANGATGTSTVDLRGLGSQRTLVLVDGKRLPPGGPLAGFASDINLIAPQLVERVDVVTGGASAVYGSDAIAGVVNFITRKDFEGVEIDAQYGFNQSDNSSGIFREALENLGETPETGSHTGNDTFQVNLLIGSGLDNGRGNVTAYFNYSRNSGLQQGSRDFAQCATVPVGADGLRCLGSNQGPFPTTFVVGATPILDANGDRVTVSPFDSNGQALSVTSPFALNVPIVGAFQNNANRQLAYLPDDDGVLQVTTALDNPLAILAFDEAGNPIFNPDITANLSLGADNGLTAGFNNAFNFNPFNPIRRQVERFNVGFNSYYDITDSVTAYMDFGFTSSSSPQIIAPSAAFGSTVNRVNCDNPVLSAEAREAICGNASINGPFTRADENGFAQAQIRRRFVEGGPRTDDRTRTNFRSVIGVKGIVDDNFDWDLFGQYSETRLTRLQFNQVTLANLTNSLDIVEDPTTGAPACRVAVDGTDASCVPFITAFDATAEFDPALQTYLDTPTLTVGTGVQTIVGGTFGGDLGVYDIKSPLADESINFLVGFEWRRDELFQQADGIAAGGLLVGAGGATVPINGETSVVDLYFEAAVPLIADMPGIQKLDLTAAYRYSDYSSTNNTTGLEGADFSTNTYALGLAWLPIDDVRIRAQLQRAVRAPNVIELFTPQNSNLTTLADPCSGTSPSRSQAECANTGLPASLFGLVPEDSGQLNTLTGGNPNLTPEESDTVTFGAVYQPSQIENLTLSVDYFDITVENAIASIPPATTLDQCLTNGTDQFCSQIQRGPDGSLTFFPRELAFIQNTTVNVAEFSTAGIDFQAQYRLDIADYGSVSFNYNSTYLLSFNNISLPGTAEFDCVGFFGESCGNPNSEYRHNFVATWSTPWDIRASLIWRYISGVDQVGSIDNGFIADGSNGNVVSLADTGTRQIDESIEAISYLDLTAFYDLTESMTIRVGVNNILDEDPPITTTFGSTGANIEANTVAGVFDAAGRFIFVGATVKF
jgi:outer membrane receptor protein involved in Fe transport